MIHARMLSMDEKSRSFHAREFVFNVDFYGFPGRTALSHEIVTIFQG